jgi:quercetin dioxygenase-like cupin family protein
MALRHAMSGEVVDLGALSGDTSATQTRALVKSDSFEAIQLVVEAGSQIPAHQVAGRFTLLCLEGHVKVGLAHGDVELSAGQWIYFDGGIRHSVDAIENSSLLLTIIFGETVEPGQSVNT